LLGAAGGALVLLPMGQVLRVQSAELQALAVERAALNPMAQLVSVQHGVLAHRDAADRVLQGRLALEPERRQRQAELDQRLRQLQDTLTVGWWMRALQESQALSSDWRQLARRVALRQIQAGGSLAAHQLLMEQAVQVMDLVQAAALPISPGSPGTLAALAARQLQDRADLGSAARLQALAVLEQSLHAQDLGLMSREAALKEKRAALALALGALLSLLALACAWALKPTLGRPQPPSPEGTSADAVHADVQERRGHGRRATDAAPRRDEAEPLLQRLRHGDVPRTPEPR
jgi:hypothetical protein